MSVGECVWTIVVAGGAGTRFGRPKQYERIDDRRVIDHACDIARSCSAGVVVVVPESDVEREGGVAGGPTRSESVRAGLEHVPAEAEVICVHDAARPFATAEVFDRVIDAVRAGADAAIPAIPVTDTIKVIASGADASDRAAADVDVDDAGGAGAGALGVVVDTPERSRLVAVQTPQAFRAERLRRAHADVGDATDDAALVEAQGGRVVVVRGETFNRKITEPDDLVWAQRRAVQLASSHDPGVA